MPNFEVTIRSDYRDIAGLVLDCRPAGLSADGSLWVNTAPPARSIDRGTHTQGANAPKLFDGTKHWRVNQLVGKNIYNVTDGSYAIVISNTENEVTATLAGGTDNDWDVGDIYVITTARFGNPFQDVAANRPVVSTAGGYKRATFTKASSHYLKVPLNHSLIPTEWTVSLDYFQGGSSSNDQTILGFPQLELYRRNGSGNFGYRYNAVVQAGSGDMADGLWAFSFRTASTAEFFKDLVSQLSGTAAAAEIVADSVAGHIGNADTGSKYADMSLRNIQIWNRILSVLELDFAHATLDPTASYSAYDRATVTKQTWTDDTGSVSRINPTSEAPHRYYHVSKTAGTKARLQIAAEVSGVVKPDTGLGGDTFSIVPIEIPGIVPGVFQDSGWSSVFDVRLEDEGHYTYMVSRINGGGIIIHFDVEDA